MDAIWIVLIVVLIAAPIVGIIFDSYLDHKEKSDFKKSVEDGNNEVRRNAYGITVEQMNVGYAPDGLIHNDEDIVSDVKLRYKGKNGYIILTNKRLLFKCLRYTGSSSNDDVSSHLVEEVCEIPVEYVASMSIQSISREFYTTKKDFWGNIDVKETGEHVSMYLLVINAGGEHKLFMGNNKKVADMLRNSFSNFRSM